MIFKVQKMIRAKLKNFFSNGIEVGFTTNLKIIERFEYLLNNVNDKK